MATTVGGVLALLPLVLLIGAVLWIGVFLASRFVSLASLVLGASLPLSAWLLGRDALSVGFCAFLALVILVRHRSNISRLLSGTEHRAGGGRQNMERNRQ